MKAPALALLFVLNTTGALAQQVIPGESPPAYLTIHDKPLEIATTPSGVSPAKTSEIDGLVSVTKRGHFHHFYHYRSTDGHEFQVPNKIKGIKDLRSYEQAHPHKTKVQAGSSRWKDTIQVAESLLQGYWLLTNRKVRK